MYGFIPSCPFYLDLSRVWIFYDENNPNYTKYSLNPSEGNPWISTGTLDELEFVDLYNQ